MHRFLVAVALVVLVPSVVHAQAAWDLAKKGAGQATTGKLEKEVNKQLQLKGGSVRSFKFVVSGHTDSTGDAEKNKQLSAERAAVMVKQLEAKGVPAADIESVVMGASQPLEKPDDTPAKKARNRRYEVQVRL
jgi:OOP family OmpA-OmpF porin